jgi:hypothetical protein
MVPIHIPHPALNHRRRSAATFPNDLRLVIIRPRGHGFRDGRERFVADGADLESVAG